MTPEPPFTLGMDMAGVVEAAGEGLEDWVGRRVVGIAQQSLGGLAELAVAGTVFDGAGGARRRGGRRLHAARSTSPTSPSTSAPGSRPVRPCWSAAVRAPSARRRSSSPRPPGARVIAVAGGPEKGAGLPRPGRRPGARPHGGRRLQRGHGRHRRPRRRRHLRPDRRRRRPRRPGRAPPAAVATSRSASTTTRSPGSPADRCARPSMLNLTVMGVLLAYFDTPRAFRQFGINAFAPETGREVHAHLLELVAAGTIRPYIGRRIGMDEVGAALADHAARRTSGRTVVRIGAMNADQLVAEAREQTGLDDLGTRRRRRPRRPGGVPRRAATPRPTSASSAGWRVHGAVVGALTNRLRVVEHHRAAPRGRATPRSRRRSWWSACSGPAPRCSPTCSTRTPPTGSLLRWESGDSVPPPAPPELRAGPRVDAGQVGVDMLEAINPGIKAIHHEDATSPTECIAVLGQAFQSISWEALANVPSYAEWWRTSRHDRPATATTARCSRCSRATAARGRWTLKSPRPRAGARRAHRRLPGRAAGGAAPRPGRADGVGVQPDRHHVVGVLRRRPPRLHRATHWTQTLEDCITAIDAHADRLHHVQYAELVTDPLGTVERPVRRPRSRGGGLVRSTRWRPSSPRGPQGVFGRHTYDLASYGLDGDELRERFAGYIDRYDVPHETPAG